MRVESGKVRAVTNVRGFRAEDLDAVMAIAEESQELAIWSRASYVKFAKEEESLALVLETNGQISGFLVGRSVGDEAEVLNLAIRKNHRRKGEGSKLLTAALGEFASRGGKSAYLEVRQSNTNAISFYEKRGFTKAGLRKGYYRQPEEAAVTMVKKLTG